MATTDPLVAAEPTQSASSLPRTGVTTRLHLPPVLRSHRLWTLLGVYGISRLYSSVLLLAGVTIAKAIPQTIPSYTGAPTFLISDGSTYRQALNFFTFSGIWDGEYYRYIFAHGYPTVLPTDGQGGILPNPWAFLPAWPLVLRGLSFIVRIGFFPLATLTAMVFGAAATVMLYAVVRERVGRRPAWFACLIFAFGPLSFLLQTSYAESMFFFLMFLSLHLMQRRRYYWLMIPAVVACFTRPGAVALALALGIVFLVRLRQARWGRDTVIFPVRERIAMVVTGLVTTGAGVIWPFIADYATGISGAYTKTELAWRLGYIGSTSFLPFTAWFTIALTYLGAFGLFFICITTIGYIQWIRRRSARALGLETIATVSSYALYLMAVFMPQQSFFRMIIPIAPLIGDPILVERPAIKRAMFWSGVALQPICIAVFWYLMNP